MGPDEARVAATAMSRTASFWIGSQVAMLPTVRHSM